MPVLVVELHVIAAVVVTRPTGLFAEQGVLHNTLGGNRAVLQLPGTLQLVQVLGPDLLQVLMQGGQQFQASFKQRLVGHVVDPDAARILVHELLEPLQTMDRQNVAWRNRATGNLVTTDLVVFERLVYRGL